MTDRSLPDLTVCAGWTRWGTHAPVYAPRPPGGLTDARASFARGPLERRGSAAGTGATWTKTDLGTIAVSFSQPPPTDGMFTAATMRDLLGGLMVADACQMYGLSQTCSTDGECGHAEYGCWRGTCLRKSPRCEVTCNLGEILVDGACVPEGSEGTDGGTSTGPRDAGTTTDDDEQGLTPISAGCECAQVELGALLLLGLAARRRRRT